MRYLQWAAVGFALIVSPDGAASAALQPGEAGLVGAWSNAGSDVVGLRLEPLVEKDGCLRPSGQSEIEVDDHPSLNKGYFWKVHRLAPGRWAVTGVVWASGGGVYQFTYAGVSPQYGDTWTFGVAPNVVTNIGVWHITKPFRQRYVVDGVALTGTSLAAAEKAKDVAPVVTAMPVRAKVAARKGDCPR